MFLGALYIVVSFNLSHSSLFYHNTLFKHSVFLLPAVNGWVICYDGENPQYLGPQHEVVTQYGSIKIKVPTTCCDQAFIRPDETIGHGVSVEYIGRALQPVDGTQFSMIGITVSPSLICRVTTMSLERVRDTLEDSSEIRAAENFFRSFNFGTKYQVQTPHLYGPYRGCDGAPRTNVLVTLKS